MTVYGDTTVPWRPSALFVTPARLAVPGLEGLLTRLLTAEVRFVVVGGYAAVAHGSTVFTEDMDICLPLDSENVESLLAATEDLNPVHRMSPARPPFDRSALTTKWKNLNLDTDWGQLDCLGEIAGLGTYQDVVQQSEEVTMGDTTCRILTIEALIRSKEAVGRPKDREAIIQLRAIRERQQEE
ncbi:MAG: nucleotidyltransferase [Planctomycetota bacterium]